jgi:hypothetical protein
MNLKTYEKDKAIIPDSMDEDLKEYDIGEMIKGDFDYEVDSKDAKEITLCIKTFSCKPQKRMKEDKEY